MLGAAFLFGQPMRFRLLRRRLTISAPRMAVRSSLAWPLRWAVAAIVLGFCAAIGLWAFEFGKDIAGLDGGTKEELVRLRAELGTVRAELAEVKEARDQAQSVANTAGTLLTTEKSSQERMLTQIKQLVSSGRLPIGTELPTIRALAEQLLINPNTVARVYRELEQSGIVTSRRGMGTQVTSGGSPLALRERTRLVSERVQALLTDAAHLGIGFDEVEALMQQYRGMISEEKKEAGNE